MLQFKLAMLLQARFVGADYHNEVVFLEFVKERFVKTLAKSTEYTRVYVHHSVLLSCKNFIELEAAVWSSTECFCLANR